MDETQGGNEGGTRRQWTKQYKGVMKGARAGNG